MRIDLHTHSSMSDGTESPTDLVAAARRAGLDVVAIADHDTTAGWDEAVDVGRRLGVEVVPAVEISTTYRGADVHLLALWPDGRNEELQSLLAGIRDGREQRLPRMLDGLVRHGIHLTVADVRRAAGPAAALGRPHVADALVAAGVVGSREEAFAQWLGEGKPGHVSKPAPPLERAIEVVHAAGGVAVLAHPWGRGSREVLGEADLADLAAAGLDGVEVDHVDHDEADRTRLRHIAARLGLIVTGASDYHGAGKAGVGLGMNLTDPDAYTALRSRCRPAPR
jgi:hypothetical protein